MANEEMIQKHLDNFLAKIAGETPVDDEPRDSTEFWLNEIAEQGGGSEVVANPTLAGTESDLTGLEVDGTKYAVPSGTEVVANPTGTGSTDLTKLQVGSTVYNIPSGGGGGGSFHEAGHRFSESFSMMYSGYLRGYVLGNYNGSYGVHYLDATGGDWSVDGVSVETREFTNVLFIYITEWYGHDYYSETGTMHDAAGNVVTFSGLGRDIVAPNKLVFLNTDVSYVFED